MNFKGNEKSKSRKDPVIALTLVLSFELAFLFYVALTVHDNRSFPWRWSSESIAWMIGFGTFLVPLFFVVIACVGMIVCWIFRKRLDSILVRASLIWSTVLLAFMVVSIVLSMIYADPTPLRTAVEEGDLEKVTKIISRGTTELDEGSWMSRKKTLVRVASEKRHTDVCRFLIEQGARVNGFRDSILAYRNGDAETVDVSHEFRMNEIADYADRLQREGKDPRSATESLATLYASGGWISVEEFFSLAGVEPQQ